MKNYTDLKQSKKLAEILPLESADMCYPYDRHLNKMYGNIPYVIGYKTFNKDTDYPCWSLAALLDIIPYNVTFNRVVYCFKLVKFSDCWECYHENFGTISTEIFKADNPVDACYEMIIKLHELNLL